MYTMRIYIAVKIVLAVRTVYHTYAVYIYIYIYIYIYTVLANPTY